MTTMLCLLWRAQLQWVLQALQTTFHGSNYDDGDEEDIFWEDVFGEGAKVKDVKLSDAAKANQKELQKGQALKERPPLQNRNNRTMTPTGTGKRPACQLAGRTAKRRAPLDDTAQKDNRGIAEEAAEDTPMMQHPRRCRSRSRRASPADTPEPEEAEPKADIPLPMETDDNDEEEEQLPTNRERKASPAAAAADAEDEEAADESPEPAARAGRKRSRSRQPAEPAGATQLVASQALTQRGSAYATQRTLTQIPRMRFPEMEPGNGVGIAGQIKSIHAEHFMSHQNFEIELGPHLNFITGENGSGKSATLQCLQVCLGARARDTGRSSAAKDLINDQASTAVAKTVLWNTGSDAYQPELYGPTITITRKLTRSGGSYYYLAAHGRSNRQVKRAEVEAIVMDHFNIDASNPIICLTQDNARSFAGNASDEEKYNLYMAATGFDAVLRGLAASEAQVGAWKERLRTVQEQLKEKFERITEIKGTMQEMEEVDSWQAEMDHLNKCIAWVGVLDMRGEAARCRVQVEEDLPRQIVEAEAAAHEKGAELEIANADFDAKKVEEQQLTAEMQQFHAEQKQLVAAAKSTDKAHRQAAQAAERAQTALENKAAELDNARHTEEDLQQQHMQATQDEAAVQAREIHEREQAADAAAAAASCASQALREAEALKMQSERELRERQGEARDIEGRVRDIQKELSNLNSSRGDPIAKFGGNDMVRLVQAVDAAARQGKFSKRPIGPIGQHLSLSDERWASAVEAAIGGGFDSFLVHSQRDLSELIDIAKRLRMRRPVITVLNFDLPAHDLSRRPQLPPDVLTIRHVLRLPEDPELARVLHNHLLDSDSIERRVLVPDADAGLHMMRTTDWFRKISGRGALSNDVWAEDCWRGFVRGDTETAMPFRGTRRGARLSKDVQGQVVELEREMASAKEAHKAAQQAVAQARREEAEAKQNVERLRKERGAADRQRARTQSQLEDMRASVQEAAAADEPDPDNAEEIERLQEEVHELQRALDEKRAKAAETAEAAEGARTAKEAQAEANKAGLAQVEAAGEAFQAAIQNKQAASDAMEEARARLHELQAKQEESLKDLQEIMQLLEGLTGDAAQECTEEEAAEARAQLKELWLGTKRASSDARAEALLTKSEMQDRWDQLKRDITKRERDMGTNMDALKMELARLSGWHTAKDAEYKQSAAAWHRFRDAYNKRRRKHEEVKDHVGKELNTQFNKYLKARKWRGGIKIRDERGTLTIFAQQDSSAGRAKTDLKTLSGGERSFVTVCYLLALCKKLQGSFHALDEFDVFMDNVNRGRSLVMIMEFAVSHKETQLILLTPLNMGAINDAAKGTKRMLPGGDWPNADFMRIRQMVQAQRAGMRAQAADP
ncbi:P-loop containing nucleoside triphosphate hydrolase protein [Coccomyxa subellipsoidea C-169]|uniref:P-loop containing nucleoside triphosphate hydrolase protein n=1 Tax=Coccomyxa subellipsoidea (strain C-169) TaxID=574566 RepID=I0Z8U8_COCSC|nr:P-loop containing nucleoside triphosphate hydrolase protein [Coccomyxa subellipsoidea C-169]EIE27067.1 P-loop containing nucleoside triphosphate hydrolase protein [Coccomyxa subellipsoidea C-169]|eukprot:XP_005651611.1 P-loop containing nucleoside triphosphate hydrolase protein [Coccomyxa subellipsoidea C-169]